jgi:hypothetical protein
MISQALLKEATAARATEQSVLTVPADALIMPLPVTTTVLLATDAT